MESKTQQTHQVQISPQAAQFLSGLCEYVVNSSGQSPSGQSQSSSSPSKENITKGYFTDDQRKWAREIQQQVSPISS